MLGTEIPTFEFPWGIALVIDTEIVSLGEIKTAGGLEPGFGSFEKGEEYPPMFHRLLKVKTHGSTRLQLLLDSRDAEGAVGAAVSLLREYHPNILALRRTFGDKVAVRLEITYFGDENEEHRITIGPILGALLNDLNVAMSVIFLKKPERITNPLS
jgi:hypothetical protein